MTGEQQESGGNSPSDRRLLEAPRFQGLRDHLQKQPVVAPEVLDRLLGLAPGNQSNGLVPLLLDAGLILPVELNAAKERKRKDPNTPLGQVLRELGLLGDEALAVATALMSRLPYLNLQADAADPEAVRHLDKAFAVSREVFPCLLRQGQLVVAVADPKRVDLEEIAAAADKPVQLAIASQTTVVAAIQYWYGRGVGDGGAMVQRELDLRQFIASFQEVEKNAAAASTVELVNWIVLKGIQVRASDLHLSPEDQFLQFNVRVDGKLHAAFRFPITLNASLVSRIKVVGGMDIAERRLPQDGDIRVRLPDRLLDIRVSCIPTVRGESVVMRLLDHQQGMVSLDQLGFFPEDLDRLRRAAALPYGMILLTGPTGSGKSTTLRAAIAFVLAQERRHVLTVEDPVEVKVPGVMQVQVNNRIDYTFAKALRHFLRHDPDVIMIGEVRDEETARIAVQAALTGHLVLSTLHTNDAPGAATRLVDMGVEPYLVSSALTLVIAQRLVRLLCPHCREAYAPSPDEVRALVSMGHSREVANIYRSRGCPKCFGTGFRGRTVIYEMLTVDESLKELISQRVDAVMLRRVARERGFVSLLGSGVRKVLEGRTTLGEVAGFLDTMGGFV